MKSQSCSRMIGDETKIADEERDLHVEEERGGEARVGELLARVGGTA